MLAPYLGGHVPGALSAPSLRRGQLRGGLSTVLTRGVGGLAATRWGPGAVRGADADVAGPGAGRQGGPPRLGPRDGGCAVRGADAVPARPRPRLFAAGSPAATAPATAEFIFDSGGRGGGGGGGGARRLRGPEGEAAAPRLRCPPASPPARLRGSPPAAGGSAPAPPGGPASPACPSP